MLHIALVLVTLILTIFNSNALYASECLNGAQNCTPDELCQLATITDDEEARWTNNPKLAEHVEFAQAIGFDCGVPSQIDKCYSQPEACSILELCDFATQKTEGKEWSMSVIHGPHVELAKKLNLDCAIVLEKFTASKLEATARSKEIMPSKPSASCNSDPAACDEVELCQRVTQDGKKIRRFPAAQKFIAEFESRNLNCDFLQYLTPASNVKEISNSFGDFPALKPTQNNKVSYEDGTKVKANFNGRFFLERFGCGTSCKFYKMWDLSTGKTLGFPYGGEEHYQHTLIHDANSGLIKIIWKDSNYDSPTASYACIIEEAYWSEESSKLVVANKFKFPIFQGDYCESTPDWKFISQQFNGWVTNGKQTKSRSKDLDFSNVTKQIQIELNRLGCEVGLTDGIIGAQTRRGLDKYLKNVGSNYDPKLLTNKEFLSELRATTRSVCSVANNSKVTSSSNTNEESFTHNNSAILEQLKAERIALEETLSASKEIMKQQANLKNAAYKSCFSRCLLGNKAGSGFSGGFNGLSQCGQSCAPLKYGGEAIPPSWERNIKRLETIDCQITQLSKNQATARCNKF